MPNKADEELAKKRFLTIQAARLAGVVIILIGLTIVAGVIPISEYIGYVLVVIGLIETLIMPVILARKWSSRNMNRNSGGKE